MLTVKDLMTTEATVVNPETFLRDAVSMMNNAGIRQLPVVDEGKLIGILTDRDIRLAVNSPLITEDAAARFQLLNQFTAADCMTPNPMTVTPDTPLHTVAARMALHKYGALPVIEEDSLVGIITVTDLLQQMARTPIMPVE